VKILIAMLWLSLGVLIYALGMAWMQMNYDKGTENERDTISYPYCPDITGAIDNRLDEQE